MKIPVPFGGQHWLVEFHGAHRLDEVEHLRGALTAAVAAAGATLLDLNLHHFGEGFGVTGVAMLSESHISVHTWPEHGYAAIDIFMCGKTASPQAALDVLQERLAPEAVDVQRFVRGYGLIDPKFD